LLDIEKISNAIIFCNRKRDVSMVNKFLQRQGRNAQDIHGDLDQSQRQATLDAFKAGKVDFLVATDVAARGLDIVDLPAVINLDVPYHPDDYVHRIGRTGRAGKEGRAFTLADSNDAKYLAAIENLLGQKLNRQPIEGISGELVRPQRPSRRATATESVDEVLPDELPPANSEAEKPAPRRRRRKSEPAGETVVPAIAAEAGEEKPKRRRRAKPASDEAPAEANAEAAAAPEVPAPAAEVAAFPSRQPRERSRASRTERKPPPRHHESGRDEPVVGLGDHVPAFLLRPVPTKVSA
jgi:superfamily II DNA/RNA helicase